MFNALKWNVNYCENLCRLAGSAVYVMVHDAVVENRVALFQVVGLLALDNLYLALHHVDELFTFVG